MKRTDRSNAEARELEEQVMTVATYECVVENGCIHLPADAMIPDRSKVYVVLPGVLEGGVQRVARIPSPRLAHPEQASDFFKMVVDVEEKTDAEP